MSKTGRRKFFKASGIAVIGGSCLLGGTGRMHAQEKPNMADKSKEFTPGEKVPASGIYNVIHDKLDGDDHAQQHQVTFIAGTVFPRCRGCGEWVRFRLYHAAEHGTAAPYFAQ